MNNGKTIGNDGQTKELYGLLFAEVTPLLVNSLNYSFTVGGGGGGYLHLKNKQ